jgi:hypothetical protein
VNTELNFIKTLKGHSFCYGVHLMVENLNPGSDYMIGNEIVIDGKLDHRYI